MDGWTDGWTTYGLSRIGVLLGGLWASRAEAVLAPLVPILTVHGSRCAPIETRAQHPTALLPSGGEAEDTAILQSGDYRCGNAGVGEGLQTPH